MEKNSSFQTIRTAHERFVRTHPWLRLAGVASLMFAFFYALAVRKIDPDFGWHLQAGNYIRAHGIPTHDIYTYTAQQYHWIDHEWGNDVIVSVLYGIGGYTLVAVPYALLWLGALLLTGLRSRLIVLYVAALAVAPYAGVRAIAWTALLLALLLRLLQSNRAYVWWVLPVLFAIWANVHAGFISGLGVIFYTAVYERRPKLLVLGLICSLATFANAYGPRLYVEIVHTIFDPKIHSQVAEWQSFAFPLTAILFIVAWGTGAMATEVQTLRRWLRLSVIFLLSAASASRNVPLFVIVATGELQEYTRRILQLMPKKLNVAAKAWLGVILIVATVAIGYATYRTLWPLRIDPHASYPSAAVSYFKQMGCNGQIFNDYNYGGYLIWKLPSKPVFIDGRMPTWRTPNGQYYLSEYYALLDNPDLYHQLFSRYDIQCSLLQKSSRNYKLIQQLRHDGWRTVIQTPDYVLQTAPNK